MKILEASKSPIKIIPKNVSVSVFETSKERIKQYHMKIKLGISMEKLNQHGQTLTLCLNYLGNFDANL